MNYNFFANKADKIKLLDFIFEETDLRIFDLSSAIGKTVTEYKNSNEIGDKFDLEHGRNGGKFQIWSPRFSQEIVLQKIDLDPARSDGHTFRYATSGFGLIQLYFGGLVDNELNYSHIGHNGEKRALLWEDTVNNRDRAADKWNWKEIAKTSRKLKSVIHNKWSVNKIGSLGVMSGADELDRKGVKMGYFIRENKI